MTPKEQAQTLYKDAFMRWCYELSHEKNVATAKNAAEYMCNLVIANIEPSVSADIIEERVRYWQEVKLEIAKL